ncbi:MAG: hypothetical protein K9M99_00930 [Candidatus Cloacimonetes bacterium]|nr:hypothetical protein [Candidatus Cloacimonadota bacterium]
MSFTNLLYIILLLAVIFLLSCNPVIPPETTSEEWIAMIDVDGNNLQFICKSFTTPYFVPDPDNTGQELIMLDGGRIDLMNQDGSNQRTIIDSVGGIYRFSEDRSKMLLVNDGEIYIANTDGSGLENLTNTPDIIEREPSFSLNEENVLYHFIDTQDSIIVLACMDLSTKTTYHLYEEEFTYLSYFISPVYATDDTVIFGQSYSNLDTLNTEGLFLYDGEIKILIDPGYINAKISYNRNNNLLAYKNSTSLKLYHTETGVIEVIEGNYGYNVSAYFNRDGSLMSFTSFVIDTTTLEGYNILRNYEDAASNNYNPIDFNVVSTKVIMNLYRVFPNSNEVGRL